jgi:aspartyl-tRNA(Asn)/glutamyl-tRNA(Gln) amidotransferase subunit C
VPVSPDDVRHVAELARLRVPSERLQALVRELNGILEHMDVLSSVVAPTPTPSTATTALAEAACDTPMRADQGPQITLERPRETFAPAMRDSFFLVPRLATHDDERASP